jgi:hypothetical protein
MRDGVVELRAIFTAGDDGVDAVGAHQVDGELLPVPGEDLENHVWQPGVQDAIVEAAPDLWRIAEGVEPKTDRAGREDARAGQVPVQPLRALVLDGAADVDRRFHLAGRAPLPNDDGRAGYHGGHGYRHCCAAIQPLG